MSKVKYPHGEGWITCKMQRVKGAKAPEEDAVKRSLVGAANVERAEWAVYRVLKTRIIVVFRKKMAEESKS
jgi:ferritin-like metal-binding protein YciE